MTPSQIKERVGQSLIKYFKPVRIANPHFKAVEDPRILSQNRHSIKSKVAHQTFSLEDQEELQKGFQKFNPKEHAIDEELDLEDEQVEDSDTEHPKQWVELMFRLVKKCRKASVKMKRRGGVNQYRHLMDVQSNQKVKTLGAIVDTNSDNRKSKKKKAS